MERLGRRRWPGVVCALVMGLCAVGQGRIIYVDDDAAGAGDGTSWADACVYLQDALAEAADCSEPVEIRVAQGVYKPDRDSAHPGGTGDRKASFHLLEGVALKGGFAGLADADPDARDVALYETVLSGDLAGDDAPVLDPCDLLTEPTRADNSRGIVTAGPCSRVAVLDGFTIRSGNITAPRSSSGAGLFVSGGEAPSCPSVRNCTFIDHHGPSVLVHNGYPEIVDCSFVHNAARGTGGAMYTWNKSVSRDCEFVVRGCTFAGNYAREWGGAVCIGLRDPSVIIEDSIFVGNHSASGGALYVGGYGSASFVNCHFVHNMAQNGTLYVAGGAAVNMASCLFAHNVAEEAGGAVYLRQADLNIGACTFVANEAPRGRSIATVLSWLYPDLASPPSATIANAIFWNGGDEIHTAERAEVNVTFSNVQGGRPGIGNIDADPLFAESGYWDSNDTPDDSSDDVWIDGDYHLKSQAGRWDPNSETWELDDVTSPCIDTGDPNAPLGDEPFPNGGLINMGAYGGTTEASKTYSGDVILQGPEGRPPTIQE